MSSRRSGGPLFFLRRFLQGFFEFEEPVLHLLALGLGGELDRLALGLDGLLELAIAEETLSESVENEGRLGLEFGRLSGQFKSPSQLLIVGRQEPGVVVEKGGVSFTDMPDEVFAHGDDLATSSPSW